MSAEVLMAKPNVSVRTQSMAPFGRVLSPLENTDAKMISPSLLSRLVLEHKVLLLRGFDDLSRRELLWMAEHLGAGKLLHWESGPVMEMQVQKNSPNYLFSNEAVPFHWDGAFFKEPSILLFNCLDAPLPEGGGETLFVNTETLWNEATEAERHQWQQVTLTYHTEKHAHYGGTIQIPMVQDHPHTGRKVLRFAEPVFTERNPVTLAVSGIQDTDVAPLVQGITQQFYSSRYCLSIQWQEGDILLADNHAVVHGRRAFTESTPRHLRRIQIL